MGKETVKNNIIPTLVGFGLSAILLTVIHAPFDLSFLAWIAWVPFILACRKDLSGRKLLICAYGVGLCYWFGNLYWLSIVTLPGYLCFPFVQALYWPVLAYGVRFVLRKRWPLFITAPILFVGAEAIQGYLGTGFSWYFLAHSQYQNLQLIQICDIFGVVGVSVLIAAANGLAAECHRLLKRELSWRIALSVFCALVLGALYYGSGRLSETPDYQTVGPMLGSVQPNVPAHVKEEIENAQEILDELIASSDKCIQAGAGLVVWPETMVLAPMNPQYISYCYESSEPPQFRRQILEHCKDRAYVLFGANSADVAVPNGQREITNQYNSAFLYRPDGQPDPKRYDKIHLVPFGEYIPFKESAPWIYKSILFMTPYDYDYNLTPGKIFTKFQIDADGRQYHFSVLICYEDTDPTVTRKHILDENGNKTCDWLVNISNDGWYVFFRDQKVRPTVELTQRTAISVFRCIENRISIIRSVNTGISCLIEPSGKIRDDYLAGDLPENAMERQGVAGWFVDTVPIDSRVTFFSRYGRWLDCVLILFFAALFAVALFDSWMNKPKDRRID